MLCKGRLGVLGGNRNPIDFPPQSESLTHSHVSSTGLSASCIFNNMERA